MTDLFYRLEPLCGARAGEGHDDDDDDDDDECGGGGEGEGEEARVRSSTASQQIDFEIGRKLNFKDRIAWPGAAMNFRRACAPRSDIR